MSIESMFLFRFDCTLAASGGAYTFFLLSFVLSRAPNAVRLFYQVSSIQ
jgi:hypothetical protein